MTTDHKPDPEFVEYLKNQVKNPFLSAATVMQMERVFIDQREKYEAMLQAAREQEGVKPNGKNEFGLDARYFHGKLGLILRDIRSYTPSEMARALGRLAVTANSETMREPEFNIGDLIDEPKYLDISPPQPQGVPEGWRVATAKHSAKAIGTESSGFLIQSPRVNGVAANTSVWEDSESLTERLLYLMLSAAPQADECPTCKGHGMIGGPSYAQPDEGGEPCPDCSEPALRERLREALTEALGEALDCTRVWGAWGIGTMSQDDFVQVADDAERVEELVEAALSAIQRPQPEQEAGQ